MRTFVSLVRPLALLALLIAATFLIAPAQPAEAQTPAEASATDAPVGSAFTYQGRLTDNGNAASARYDFQFILYDAATGGSQQGATVTRPNVSVNNGLFTVQLDFGQAVFTGEARFLEVGVKPAGSSGAYTVLSPRTALTAVPYALGMPGVVAQNGNVGIGTNSPQAKLQIINQPQDPSGNTLVLGPNDLRLGYHQDYAWIQSHSLKPLHINPFGNNIVTSLAAGNVGIGSPNPQSKLHVVGGTLIEGVLQVNSNITMAGNDFVMLPSDRGDGGRALVHWVDDVLLLNIANDFSGGVLVDSLLRVNGNMGTRGRLFTDAPDFDTGQVGAVTLYSPNGGPWWHIDNPGHLRFSHGGNPGDGVIMAMHFDGRVGIGVEHPASKFHVAGGDIRVSGGNFIKDGTTLNVPDYVFEADYPLMPLDELAAYIAAEKHLPGVPSASDIARDGLNVSEFHMRLLEKVEELTLYTLAQQAQIDAQQTQIEALEARLAALEE